MHDYAMFGHDRANVGRWLTLISTTIAGGLAQVSTFILKLTGWQVPAAFIATGMIYVVLHILFRKYLWFRMPFLDLPNINGLWEIQGRTLAEDNSVRYEWPAQLDIEQNWEQITIKLKTAKSQSDSYTATISKVNGSVGGWLLSYSYNNTPEIEQSHELNSHKGFCEIRFNKELTIGKADYFNSNGRRTFGYMTLKKV